MKKESEFGKGFIYSLILFVHHMDNPTLHKVNNIAFVMRQNEEKRKQILNENPPDNANFGFNKDVKWWYKKIMPIWGSPEKALSQEITLWMNGASDHLYELEIPNKFKGTKIEELSNWLKDFCLEMGHGFMNKKLYTWDDIEKIWDTCKEIGLLIDKEFDIDPTKGQWE